jgi:uncharacterized protein (DUF2267 family)
MSGGIHIFDAASQEANLWLKSIMERLVTDDAHVAYLALRSTLHVLRDRIGPEPAVHLGAQLPMLVRGLYYEGWHMAGTPTRERHVQDFLDHVRTLLPDSLRKEAERMVRAIFELLAEKLSAGEAGKVVKVLPEARRARWPPAAARSDPRKH